MAHPPAEELARFVAGALDEGSRAAIERELARCAECRALVGALARDGIPRTHVGDASPADAPTLPRALLPLAPGAMIGGRYRVVRLLGEGGMGVVHEVEHELLGRRFALKTLHPAIAMQAEAVRRFTAEARAATAIAHPGIVDVVDLGRTDDGAPFLVMELLDGVTLETFAREHTRATVDDVIAIARGIASALAAAHAAGIIHRDVKPANVMLAGGATDRVKLLDFGIAKLASPDGTRTRSGMMLGTPRYMAPEQWLAAPDVDARADVFALGVSMYRLATGEMPYEWSDFALGAASPTKRSARPVQELAPEMPPALAELIDRAIAVDRAERPNDGGEMERALERIASTRARIAEAMRTLPPPPPERAADTSGRPVVGRARELDELDRMVVGGRAVAVVGPPGIGKSALLDAWLARRALPVARIVVQPSDAEHPLRSLARALSARSPDTTLRDVEAPRDRVALAIARALDVLDPPLIVLDDAGFLDPQSVRVLAERVARDGGIAVLLALRDGAERARLEPLAITELPLRGLEIADVGEVARAAGAFGDPVRLHARTGGNPLFVEQLLALDPELRSSDTVWPADVHAAVRARIAALPSGEAHAWKVAAVIGAPFHPRDLAALGVHEPELVTDALVRREVLSVREAGLLAFGADVLRDVAYEAVPSTARAALHGEIAGVLARDPRPEWPEVARHFERADDLQGAARAYARAALEAPPSLAAERRAKFAERAIELGGTGGALARAGTGRERAQHVDGRAPSGRAEFEALGGVLARAGAGRERAQHVDGRPRSGRAEFEATRLELEIVRIDSLELAGAFDASLEAIDALLARTTEPDPRAQARLRRGVILQRTGRGTEALAELAAAVTEGQGGGAPATLARALGKHAVALAYANRIDEARTQLAAAERTMWLRAPELRAEAAVWRAQIAGVSGDLGDRRNSYWAAVELYRESGDLRLAAGAAMNLADTYNQLGAYDEAERALERAREECRALGVHVMAGYAALNLGFARIERGALDDAGLALDEAAAIAAECGETRLSRFASLYRARLDLGRGASDDARDRLLALVADAAGSGDRPLEALAESALARVLLASRERPAALQRSERAIAVLEALGGLEEGEAEVRWTHARCLAAAGRDDDAAHALTRGADFVRDLARRIGDPEWRARLLEDVDANRALLAGELPITDRT